MKKVLLVAFAALFVVGGAWADEACEGCSGIKIGGYIGPNFRMIDKGESDTADPDDATVNLDNVSNTGFGVAFARLNISGMHALDNEIVNKIGWKFETDIKQNTVQGLVYAYVDAYLGEQFMARLGRQKEVFGREWLHATGRLLTVDRHVFAPNMLKDIDYSGYSYGLTAFFKHEMFKAMAGVYDGQGRKFWVGAQDPALDFAFRAVAMPTEGLEVGANVAMKTLPGVMGYYDTDGTFVPDTTGSSWGYWPDGGTYVDHEDYYQTNSGMAFGADLEYKKKFEGDMWLWAQAEFGTGDNPYQGAKDAEAEDTWEDYEWYSFQYFYVKALFMATKLFGVHAGFSTWDPNTESGDEDNNYLGENDATTKITPGITLMWSDHVRTQVEVQLITEQQGVYLTGEDEGENKEDCEYTHFVLQQVVNF